ncbi:MAG: hypothetical protein SAK29_40235 [Scytonema sp. PMC 1069.18]|nr:hypothetical protein [Scytonema sp. PMC 1069.18]MEC4882628.1 hypothetical protein [Scytonema sp. PMC 1070.18]
MSAIATIFLPWSSVALGAGVFVLGEAIALGKHPMLAQRAIEEEYLGLEVEGGDHRRYFDITPLILLAGIVFVVMRFIGLGTGDQALYIFGGIAAAIVLGLSRALYNLPHEGRRIR